MDVIRVLCKIPTVTEVSAKSHTPANALMDEKQYLVDKFLCSHPPHGRHTNDWFETNHVFLRYDVAEGEEIRDASAIVIRMKDGTEDVIMLDDNYYARALKEDYSPHMCGGSWRDQFSMIIIEGENDKEYCIKYYETSICLELSHG